MIIITGASGLLGANFLLHLINSDSEVIGIYKKHKISKFAQQTDLLDFVTIENLFKKLQPNWIIHCAAATNIDWCEQNPGVASQLNTQVPQEIAKIARKIDAGMVYISTDSVFDGQVGYYTENDPPSPVNVYSRTKLAGEKAVTEALEHSLIIRTNIYGWNMQPKTSLGEWILQVLENQSIVPGFYDVTFAPILVNDLIGIILDMINKQLTGIYHVNGSQSCSKYEFAIRLAQIFGYNINQVQPTSIHDSPLQTRRPLNTSLQTTKVDAALDHRMPDVNTGLEHFKSLRETGYIKELKALGRF